MQKIIFLLLLPLIFLLPNLSAAEIDLLTLSLKQHAGRGMGYDSGYTTFSGYAIPFRINDSISFADARVHYFDHSNFAGNLGAGFRTPLKKAPAILGINAFYDYRRDNDQSFNQFGVGLELLSSRWGLSINGYFPFAKTEQTISTCFNSYVGGYFVSKKKIEKNLKGVDLQAIVNFFQVKEIACYLLGGPYYYNGICRNFLGIKGAVALQWSQYVRLAVSMSYDSEFKGRMQGELAFFFPFGWMAAREKNYLEPLSISLQPVQRNEVIVLDQFYKWKWNY